MQRGTHALLSLLCIGLLALGSRQPAHAAAEQPAVTVLRAANLRGGPGTAYPIIGGARPQQTLAVTGRANGWYQVRAGGRPAWIAGFLVTPNAAARQAPVVMSLPARPPAKAQVAAQGAAQPLPELVVLGADTVYPVRAQLVRGWHYEFVDRSTGYDIVVQRDVFGMLSNQIAQDNYRRQRAPAPLPDYVLRIVLVDAQRHPDPACAGWGWVGDRNTTLGDPLGLNQQPCRVQHALWPNGDGQGATLLVGSHYDGNTVAVGAYGPTGADWSTTYFAESITWPGHLGPADRPDFTLPLYAPLGQAHKEAGRWVWVDPFVQIVPAAGQVAAEPAAAAPPSAAQPASPATGQIVFTSGTAVQVVDVASGRVTTRAEHARQADLAADGRLVFQRPGGNIQLDGQAFGLHPEERAPAFLAGGQIIVHGNLTGQDRLYVYSARQREPQALEANNSYRGGRQPLLARYPLAGPGGQLVAAACDSWAGGGACGVWSLTSPDGATWRGVAQLSTEPNDRPTAVIGNQVLWASAAGGNWEVWTAPFTGGPARNLTNSGSQDLGGTLSPDGQWLAFMSDRDGAWAIWLAQADGSQARRLLAVPAGFGPAPAEERLVWR